MLTETLCVCVCACGLNCVRLFARLLCPWGFPDKNNGMGCHFLLQGMSPVLAGVY